MALKAVREGGSQNKDQATGPSSPKPVVVPPPKPGVFEFDAALSTVVLRTKPTLSPKVEPKGPLAAEMLDRMQRYWDAANYLTVGQIYLADNPLLQQPLRVEHIKPRLLGHWGTSAGQNFIYTHLNRLIKENEADVIYISGPGHGGPP